jgi:uncharacterized RDD family membrane protein YckC
VTRGSYDLADIPRYDQYGYLSLYEALNNIAADKYPDTFSALEKELNRRVPESKHELEECYYRLDKKKWPQYALRLRRQIAELGGFTSFSHEPISEAQKYRTFWRRVGALIVDSFVLLIPPVVLLLLFGFAIVENKSIEFYVELTLSCINLGYSILMHTCFGQTVGKMALGVKVVDVSEERGINFKQAVLRDSVPLAFFVAMTSYYLAFGYGQVEQAGLSGAIAGSLLYMGSAWGLAEMTTMLFNRKRRAVHDYFARSVVIRVP